MEVGKERGVDVDSDVEGEMGIGEGVETRGQGDV